MYFEELKRELNAEIGPKDIFEIASNYFAFFSALTSASLNISFSET